jgi:hypothetical protein
MRRINFLSSSARVRLRCLCECIQICASGLATAGIQYATRSLISVSHSVCGGDVIVALFLHQSSIGSSTSHVGSWRATCPSDGHAGRVATSFPPQPLQRVCAPTSGTGKAGPSCAISSPDEIIALCPHRLHQQKISIPSRLRSPSAIARRLPSSSARCRCFIRPMALGCSGIAAGLWPRIRT